MHDVLQKPKSTTGICGWVKTHFFFHVWGAWGWMNVHLRTIWCEIQGVWSIGISGKPIKPIPKRVYKQKFHGRIPSSHRASLPKSFWPRQFDCADLLPLPWLGRCPNPQIASLNRKIYGWAKWHAGNPGCRWKKSSRVFQYRFLIEYLKWKASWGSPTLRSRNKHLPAASWRWCRFSAEAWQPWQLMENPPFVDHLHSIRNKEPMHFRSYLRLSMIILQSFTMALLEGHQQTWGN